MRFFVYGLFDPRDGQLRYIGQTGNHPEVRLYQHTIEPGTKDKFKWITDLQSLSLNPEITVFEEWATRKEAREAEAWCIAYFTSLGCDLLNLKPGGRPSIEMSCYVGIKIPEDLKKWIEMYAQKRMVSVSDVVRQALLEEREREDGHV